MPLHIIRNDITKVECDAIVNSANCSLLGGSGVDGAIHSAAGKELLEECKTLGGCGIGHAKITKGYKLPCKYVIHTVGPVWKGGHKGEKDMLISCYKNSLNLAKENGCESVAFPLISSGVYAYPKEQALHIAMETISEFLLENEMTVYLVVYDNSSFEISKSLFYDVKEYIDDVIYIPYKRRNSRNQYSCASLMCYELSEEDSCFSQSVDLECSKKSFMLEQMLDNIDDTFSVTLLKLIDIKGMSDVECYKKANVSRQTWCKIMNEKNYKPSKNTVIAFAIALQLTLEETKKLLLTVGFALSKSSRFDIIIEYFIVNKVYDIYLINETLFKFDEVGLGLQ